MELQFYELSKVCAIINESKKFVVVSHYNPDADAYGSSCGLALALKAQGKEVVIVNETGIIEGLTFIPGVASVKSKIPPGDFNAFLVCDCGDEKRIGESFNVELQRFPTLVNIDHHSSNPGFGQARLVDPRASSTSELIFRLLRELRWKITPEIATCLYAGLSADTGSFCYGSTTQVAFEIAAELVKCGANPPEIANSLYRNVSLASVKLYAAAIEEMELHFADRVAIATVTKEMFEQFRAKYDDAERFSERVTDIRGVVIGCSIRNQEGIWHVSLRSKNPKYDVGAVASKFGGGGHKAAAAFRTKQPLEEIKPKLIEALGGLIGG